MPHAQTLRPFLAHSAALALMLSACAAAGNDGPRAVLHARFDPDEGAIPMPSDLVRDDERGVLDLDAEDEGLTAAERDVYGFLNTMDGWSTVSSARVEFTGELDPTTVGAETVEVWRWTGADEPVRITDVGVTLDEGGRRIVIEPSRFGWDRGARYFAFVRGGADGLRGKRGEVVEADAAFYFLRLSQALDDPEYQRAFPGDTRAERLETGADLEAAREELRPYFEFLERGGTPRADVAALWSFTVTDRAELLMDRASQRVPIPFDLLFDPEAGHVSLEDAEWDKAIERRAKHKLRDFDGFALSAELLFGFSAPVDPATFDADAVELYEVADPPVRVPARVEVYDGNTQVAVIPDALPLKPATTYGLVVRDTVRDAAGRPVAPMVVGHAMRSEAAFAIDGRSEAKSISDESARRLEWTRERIAPLLDRIGRDGVLTAWPFTTLDAGTRLDRMVRSAETFGLDPNPTVTRMQSALEATAEFPLGFSSLLSVARVATGTIQSPDFLDRVTRGLREGGAYTDNAVTFTMAVPKGIDPGDRVPVVVFGHGIMTERRFVLAVADALTRRGFAAVSIDLPYHGTRTQCVDTSPLAIVDPRSGEVMNLPPCKSGAICTEEGQCVAPDGSSAFAQMPVVGYPAASGAAFLELDLLPEIRDHFLQAYVDLGSLTRSLREGDWSEALLGGVVDTDNLTWVGQSLGGIIGATFVATHPEFRRAVFNVPGADLVDMFDQSTFFGPQIDGYFVREGIERSGYEGRRFLNIARWLIDPVDPQSVAARYRERPGLGFIQMAKGDFIVPNSSTDVLTELSGMPRYEYLGTHAFLTIPEPAALPGLADMGDFLTDKLEP